MHPLSYWEMLVTHFKLVLEWLYLIRLKLLRRPLNEFKNVVIKMLISIMANYDPFDILFNILKYYHPLISHA